MKLRDEIDGEYSAGSIILDSDSRYTILVEGDTDEVFFSRFFNSDFCQIEVLDGKENIIIALEIVNSQQKKKEKTFAIVDKDFDFLFPLKDSFDNLLYTDFHDVEMMCVHSEAFQNFEKEYFSKEKCLSNQKKLNVTSIKEHLIALTKHIGFLRIVDRNEGFNLAFKSTPTKPKEFKFNKFICKDELIFNGYNYLIETIKTFYNQAVGLNNLEIEKKIRNLDLESCSDYDICNGHDFSRVILVLMGKLGKSKIANTVTHEEIERALRLSYSLLDFNKTILKQKIASINDLLLKN